MDQSYTEQKKKIYEKFRPHFALYKITGKSASGRIKIVMDGNFEASDIKISPGLLASSVRQELKKSFLEAVNDANNQIVEFRDEAAEEILKEDRRSNSGHSINNRY